MRIRIGTVLHGPVNELDTALETRGCNGGARPLEVDGDWLDTDARYVVRLNEADQVSCVPASCVEDNRTPHQVLACPFVQPVWTAGLEASVEKLVHVPRRVTVDPRKPFKVP